MAAIPWSSVALQGSGSTALDFKLDSDDFGASVQGRSIEMIEMAEIAGESSADATLDTPASHEAAKFRPGRRRRNAVSRPSAHGPALWYFPPFFPVPLAPGTEGRSVGR